MKLAKTIQENMSIIGSMISLDNIDLLIDADEYIKSCDYEKAKKTLKIIANNELTQDYDETSVSEFIDNVADSI